jgi:hypothetical protein
MAKLGKAHHIVHRSVCSLGKTVNFAATPKEGQTHFIGAHNPANPVGYSWEGSPSAQYGYLSTAPGSGVLAAGYTKDYGDPRPDLKLTAFKGSGLGFTFTHQVSGKSGGYNQFHGNRGIRTELYEMWDAAPSTWQCYSGGHVASSIILPQGVTSRRANNGEDVLIIQSATPDAFLANLSLPQMPYILAGPANEERYAQWFLATNGWLPPPALPPNPLPTSETRKTAIQKVLGRRLEGEGDYTDPFAGFANYRDQYTIKVGELMEPAPANDLHFFNYLSSSRVIVEILTNHVLANGKSLGQTFGMEILTGQDPESDLLHFEVAGGINSIIQEAAQHGVWRAWWDSRSNFHFILDYYGGGGNGKVAATITDGPSLIGELEVMLGSTEARVNRVAVRPQFFLSFGGAQTGPMENYYDMVLGAVYPPGAVLGGNGTDITQDNYMGKNAAGQAYRLFHKENAQTTFSWKNVPYPGLIMGLLNREVRLKAKDPKGAWDFSSGDGKRFIVTDVEGQLADGDSPNGGYWLCSCSGIEI